jgi:hypothetical protein
MVAHHCAHCSYITSRKYNMERHSIMVHNILYLYNNKNNININNNNTINSNNNNIINNKKTIIDDPNTIIDNPNTIIDNPNTIIDNPNTIIDGRNTIIDNQIETDNNICIKCNKTLSSKSSLKKHSLTCKGVINPLECYICHKIFTTSGNKSRHIKICKSKALVPIDTNNNTVNNNININSINNNTNNINTNNINTNNINNTNNILQQNNNIIINFGNGSDQIEFKNDHINAKMLNDMYSSGNVIDGLRQYIIKTFEDPSNRLIKKTNVKSNISKVHNDGKWETRLDIEVLPRLLNHIANNNWEKLRYYDHKQRITLHKQFIKRILQILEMFTSWDNLEDYDEANQKRLVKQAINMLKLVIVDFSKEDL